MKNFINDIIDFFDAKLVRKSTYDKIKAKEQKLRDYELSELIDKSCQFKYLENLQYSKSQLRQDLFVLSELGFKQDGYFIEFGATDGITLSNTHLLEEKFNWKGILAEPAKLWHKKLESNRKAFIDKNCVWKTSGETLLFNEVDDESHNGELSTIDSFSNFDNHRNVRKLGSKYNVNTISLIDLLNKFDAPKKIDYLSIDTEGSEFEILNAFDFNKFDIKIITCEHNYTSMQSKIFELLSKNGYKRKYCEFSLQDDWYVRE